LPGLAAVTACVDPDLAPACLRTLAIVRSGDAITLKALIDSQFLGLSKFGAGPFEQTSFPAPPSSLLPPVST
jgi:hypothetical protein